MPMISKEIFNSFQKSSYLLKIKDNTFPILITICFFIFSSYFAFFHNPISTQADCVFYLS